MRVRFRPAYNDAELAAIYAEPHRHDHWPDHVLRVAETIALARELGVPDTIADLSCGDAAIATALREGSGRADLVRLHLGDLAPGYEYHGPIERTITEIPRVGMLVCTETIEHLDCPDGLLIAARVKADLLVLSTPLGETVTGAANAEHYWGWDHEGVREMLDCAGWETVLQRDVTWTDGHGFPWSYQIWGCR